MSSQPRQEEASGLQPSELLITTSSPQTTQQNIADSTTAQIEGGRSSPESDDSGFLEPDATDRDSAVDVESYATSTYTFSSDVGHVVEEFGRTYHVYKDGSYMLPNDEIELNRLDMQNKMWSITLDEKLHLAPINPKPNNVLDIGTGTGIWAIDFAEAYSSAKVIGTDLSVSQPEYIPTNCQFEIDDAEDEWVFPMKFDYIHGRALATCFNDPAAVIKRAFDALVPGGYLEMQDVSLQTCDDGSMTGTALLEWQSHIMEAGKKVGRTWDNVVHYERWLKGAGFVDVEVKRFRWPSNQWSEDRKERILGAWQLAQIEEGLLESVSTRMFMGILGWSKEQLTVFLAKVRKDCFDRSIKAYSPISVVYGRKPL